MMTQPIGFMHESDPPRFLRAQALPYPELTRVWARVQLTDFGEHPELEMVILGPDGQPQASMVMVDVQHTYVSLTMHLRRPAPGQEYHLLLRLTRAGLLLDQRDVPFPLVFVERDAAKAEAEEAGWTGRGVPISPLSQPET